MKDRIKGFFSISASDLRYFNSEGDKIEVAGCPKEEKICNEYLLSINKRYLEADKYLLNKDFKRSIETLKDAFYMTTELQDSSCMKCAEVFRATITQSMENIQDDLEGMTTGMFKTKRFQPIYKEVGVVLQEFKNVSTYKKTKKVLQDLKNVG